MQPPMPSNHPEEHLRAATEDGDDAVKLVGEQAHHIDHCVVKKAVRKMDMFFLPTMILGYGIMNGSFARSPNCTDDNDRSGVL